MSTHLNQRNGFPCRCEDCSRVSRQRLQASSMSADVGYTAGTSNKAQGQPANNISSQFVVERAITIKSVAVTLKEKAL